MTEFIFLASWNTGGVHFLKAAPEKRKSIREKINKEIRQLVEAEVFPPDFILLQEIVKYEEDGIKELIDPPKGYYYQSSIAIDTVRQTHPEKWNPIRKKGQWQEKKYMGQGNGILWRKEIPHSSIWECNSSKAKPVYVLEKEDIRIDAGDTGFFTGNRDTEPRIAVVSHFIMGSRHIFIVNLHMTTFKGEREGFPEKDDRGSKIRLNQTDIILNGIVSRYNSIIKFFSV